MIARHTDKHHRLEMLAQFGNELCNQFWNTLDLLNHILFVGDSNRLVNIAADCVTVWPDNAILTAMSLADSNDPVQISAHHLSAHIWVVCIPMVVHIRTVMDVVETDQQVIVGRLDVARLIGKAR